MTVRVRFAPSPTGFLHVGGARTASFNWRPRTLPALVGQVRPFVVEDVEYEQAAVDRFWKKAGESARLLRALAPDLAELPEPWTRDSVEPVSRGLAERLEVGAG